MDNLGKCHGKINIMIGLKANGSSSNWLPPIHCRTCDAHMSISNKPHHNETKANSVKCCKMYLPPASSILQQHELLQLPDKHERKESGVFFCFFVLVFFWKTATSIYLKHTILSVSVDLAKKSKFYKTQVVVLQLVYKAHCITVAKGRNSTQPTSSVHLHAPTTSLAQF